ncbi:bifunctional riboflavin kinase/FAD synthetase [Dokdonella sp.]|uniref:bifunctional riboflavin kinase/FAD synthetase n=1 Tax=Dokdonella sp. TaxID=2291710 RepID=UPI003AF8309D
MGAFDGVHPGHRALLARVRERAAALRLLPLAISFEPLPREFFARGAALPRLTSVREKLAGLFDGGMQCVLLLRFNKALAAIEPEQFIDQVLVARCAAQEVWIGADFRFGHRRRGDIAMLRAAGARHGFRVEVLPDVGIDSERVSSSAIRARLAAGEFAQAARLLGRPFTIGGRVVRGARLGRTLGWPTANLRLGRRSAPVAGIFAVRVHGLAGAGADGWPGVASLGVRPTVAGNGEALLEVHLFDFDGDLYGRRIEVEFVARLRDEVKFDDLDTMVGQIERDAAQARAILGVPALPEDAGSRLAPG